jgi:hypothetical protein
MEYRTEEDEIAQLFYFTRRIKTAYGDGMVTAVFFYCNPHPDIIPYYLSEYGGTMKTTGKCPRCGGTDVYHNDGIMKLSERSFIYTWVFGRAPLITYICASCGCIEDYLDISKKNHLARLRKNWKRAGMI